METRETIAMRIAISKSLRFEVFKRDSFTCQYCGRKAPDVLLEADHIEPVAKGGSNHILNLTTACKDCNAGKSDKRLSDSTVLDKQREQLEALQERRDQIDMMFQWQKGLSALENDVLERLQEIWSVHVPGYSLNENGILSLKKLNKKFSIEELITAIRVATEQYMEYANGSPTKESVELAWSKIGGICRISRIEKDNPDLKRLYYIRGILRNRLSYCNVGQAMHLLQEAHGLDASVESLETFAKSAKNWTTWRAGMEAFISQHVAASDSEDIAEQAVKPSSGSGVF